MKLLQKRLAALETAKSKAWDRVRRVILREGEPEPEAEPGELLIVRRIIGTKGA